MQLGSQESSIITGFPTKWFQFCTGELKKPITGSRFLSREGTGARNSKQTFFGSPIHDGDGKHTMVQYVGIAIDEPERLARLDGITKKSPLAAAGWTEADAKQWCTNNDLLSPIYENTHRGGCWFCHNQTIQQMRDLRHNYPDLWEILLKWDLDSPTTWHPDGRTVHDFDLRFKAEDLDLVPTDRKFRWKMLEKEEITELLSNPKGDDNDDCRS